MQSSPGPSSPGRWVGYKQETVEGRGTFSSPHPTPAYPYFLLGPLGRGRLHLPGMRPHLHQPAGHPGSGTSTPHLSSARATPPLHLGGTGWASLDKEPRRGSPLTQPGSRGVSERLTVEPRSRPTRPTSEGPSAQRELDGVSQRCDWEQGGATEHFLRMQQPPCSTSQPSPLVCSDGLRTGGIVCMGDPNRTKATQTLAPCL